MPRTQNEFHAAADDTPPNKNSIVAPHLLNPTEQRQKNTLYGALFLSRSLRLFVSVSLVYSRIDTMQEY